jgi:hypothetical protein
MRLVQRNGLFGLQRSFCGIPEFGKFQDLEAGFEWAQWARNSRHFSSCWGNEYLVRDYIERLERVKAKKKQKAAEKRLENKITFVDYVIPNFCERVRIRLLKLVGISRGNSGIVANG